MPLITKLILSLSLLIANTNVSHAKRDFYVPKEITCTKELCYLKKTKSPFTGELKEFDYNGKLYSSTEYKNGKIRLPHSYRGHPSCRPGYGRQDRRQ
jgi:antitoxin component YwqK of YwqJK toxin-antitoxin module